MEGFAELLVPVLADQPFAKHLNLELGYRFSNYLYSDSVSTWKALVDWAFTSDLRLRGGIQRASRAANLGERFQKPTHSLSVSPGDPCGTGFTLNYGANPTTNAGGAAGAAKVRALCEALMGPIGATAFYSNTNNQAAQGGFAFEFQKLNGNPNLDSEKAKTFTLGLVQRSPFDHPLAQFTVSADYYRIKVSDAISTVSLTTLYQQCYNEQYNPALQANNIAGAATFQFCQQLPRNQTTGGKERGIVTYRTSASSTWQASTCR
jgi:outer membrane receptor protein involved in Fe transport